MATRAIGDTATVQDLDARLTAVELNKADITALASYAPLASPTFTGVPLAPTAAAGTNTTQIATTAFVAAARAAILVSPAFTGTPTAPTAAGGTNTTQIATTAFVISALSPYAPLASPTFTGTPSGPTASAGTNTTQIATTAFVAAAVSTAGGTFLAKSSNLSDLASPGTARTNLGLAIGVNVQAYSANLTPFAARAIGVASSTDIPDRASTDARYALASAVSGAGLSRRTVAELARAQALNVSREAASTAIASTTTTDTVYGGVSYDSFDGTSGQSFAQILTHGSGVLKQVRLRFGGAATGFIDIIRPSTGAILQSFSVTASGAGITTVTIPGSYVLPADAVVGYRAVTGAQIRYAAGTASHYYYTSSDASDANVTLGTDSGALLSIEYTVAVPQASSAAATVSTVYGSIVPDSANGVSGESFGPLISHDGGPLTRVRVRLASSGTGKIDILNTSGIILQSFDVTAASAGVVTLTSFGGYVLPANAIVAYRAVSGALIRDAAGPGSIYYYTSSDASDNAVTLSTDVGVQIALEYTVAVTPTGGTYPVAILDGSGWNGLITYGQSLSAGLSATPAVSTTAPYPTNLTFGSGVRSSKPGNGHSAGNTSPGTTTTKSLLEDNTSAAEGGTAGESLCTGAASYAVTLAAVQQGVMPANFVIFGAAAGHGGYTMAQLVKGTAWYPQLTDLVSEMTARAAAAGKTAKVIAIPWMQGENDGVSGTSRTGYLTGFKMLADAMNGDIKTLTGQGDDVHVLTYQTATAGGSALSQLNAIQLAQLDAANQHPRIHLVSPIYHLMAGSPEGVHLGPVGQLRFGRYVGRAFYQLSVERREPDRIRILSATAKGTTLTIRFDVPTAPLVIDAFIPVATDNGFKVVDGSGTLTLSGMAVGSDGTSVTMTLNRSLGTNPTVRYALDFIGSGITINNGASGNLRDSTPDSFVYSGTTYPIYHTCPHFEQPIAVIENA